MTHKPIILTVHFAVLQVCDIAKFKLTIPELPKEKQLIRINGATYKVYHIGIIDYSEETVIIYLKEIK